MKSNISAPGWKRSYFADFGGKIFLKMLTYLCMLRFFEKFFHQTQLKYERLCHRYGVPEL